MKEIQMKAGRIPYPEKKYVGAVELAEGISKRFSIPLVDLVDAFAEIPPANVMELVVCKCCGKPIRFPVAYHTACYEAEVERVAECFCRDYCRFPRGCDTQEDLDEHCDDCPFIGLSNAIGTAPEESPLDTDEKQPEPPWKSRVMRTFLGGDRT